MRIPWCRANAMAIPDWMAEIATRSNSHTLAMCANAMLWTTTKNKEGYESEAKKPERMANPKSGTGVWRWVSPPGKPGS
jgi:hypothetical protein